jgi:hypothetical protein
MRVLICGGRDFDDTDLFNKALGAIDGEIEIISGMAPGADTMAADFAKAYGYALHEFPADWNKHGKAAGPIRNQQMLDEGRPDLLLAFPGGRGTQDMLRRAKKHRDAFGYPRVIIEVENTV